MTTEVTISNAADSTHYVNVSVGGSGAAIVAPGSSTTVSVGTGQTYSLTQGNAAGGMPSGPDNS